MVCASLQTIKPHTHCTLAPGMTQVSAIEGEILLVSQFTLYGRLKKPKPDYSKAMGPDQVRVHPSRMMASLSLACWH